VLPRVRACRPANVPRGREVGAKRAIRWHPSRRSRRVHDVDVVEVDQPVREGGPRDVRESTDRVHEVLERVAVACDREVDEVHVVHEALTRAVERVELRRAEYHVADRARAANAHDPEVTDGAWAEVAVERMVVAPRGHGPAILFPALCPDLPPKLSFEASGSMSSITSTRTPTPMSRNGTCGLM
jgi:hypothetical protein